jgi:amino acid transporter
MVGGGIFAVLGTAADLAKGGTPIAFLIAGLIALLTAYSYARLSATFPSAGGTVVFIDKAFGVEIWTGAANLMLYLSYLVTIGLYASAFGTYAATFGSQGDQTSSLRHHFLISTAIIVPAIINLFRADFLSKIETLIVVIKLSLVVVVVTMGLPYVSGAALSTRNWSSPFALIAGGMVIFVAYEGFELIANAGDDVRDPAKTMPKAYYLSVVSVIALYILVAIVTVGSLSDAQIERSKDYALAEAAKPSLGAAGFSAVAAAALLATFSAINATIYGNARLGYTVAKDGELPEFIERKYWHRPVAGVATTTVVSLLLANLIDREAIATTASAGFLLIFAVVNAACWKMAEQAQASRVVCAISWLLSSAALVTLLVHTYVTDFKTLLLILGMVAFRPQKN